MLNLISVDCYSAFAYKLRKKSTEQ